MIPQSLDFLDIDNECHLASTDIPFYANILYYLEEL